MMTMESLAKRLERRFDKVSDFDGRVIVCEEGRNGDSPFALHYFTPSENINDYAENLESFQDDVIGRTYFESKGDLRWNHYLYFVVPNASAIGDEYDRYKRKIEGDKSYARKFVLTEEELDGYLLDRPFEFDGGSKTVDIMSRWVDALVEAGLDVVLENRSLSETVRLIGEGYRESNALDKKKKREAAEGFESGFLADIDLKEFRRYPQQKQFTGFGSVNLIVGRNGVGKTSLLEAIEYLYCGECARNSQAYKARVSGRLRSGKLVNSSSDSSVLKARNLRWYGVRDLKQSTLHNSFSRFNFLNADEAVKISLDNKVDYEQQISQLVVGPQASELWSQICKLSPLVKSEVDRLATQMSLIGSDLDLSRQRLLFIESQERSSDKYFYSLAADLQNARWLKPPRREFIADVMLPEITRACSLVRGVVASSWVPAGANKSWIYDYRSDVERRYTAVAKRLSEIESLRSEIRRYQDRYEGYSSRAVELRRYLALFDAGAFKVFEQLQKDLISLSEANSEIGSFKFPDEIPSVLALASVSLSEVLQGLRLSLHMSEQGLEESRRLLELVRKSRKEKEVLIQEIKRLAKQFWHGAKDSGNCPVCYSSFTPDELGRRINMSSEKTDDKLLEEASSRYESAVEFNRSSKADLQFGERLAEFADRSGLSIEVETPNTIFIKYRRLERLKVRLSEQIQQASFDLDSLEVADIRLGEARSILEQAVQIGGVIRRETLQEEISRIDFELEAIRGAIQSGADRIEAARSSAMSEFVGIEFQGDGLDGMLSALEKRRFLVSEALSSIEGLEQFIDFGDQLRFVDIQSALESAVLSAEGYLKAAATEVDLTSEMIKLRSGISRAEAESEATKVRYERTLFAWQAIRRIQDEMHLKGATEDELLSVQSMATRIFNSIHSPREYSVARGLQRPLMRIEGGELVSLTEVSTGQRAAFVLSLFMAMNAKASAAPSLVIFDDPVAHIDDFNALSFLDCLRHLALTGKRQIFYATADSRLAGLFSHKFAFLGDEFRRFDLER